MIRCLLLSLLALTTQAATTITLRPSNSTPNSGDAYNRAAAATTNFGNSGALVISGSGAGNANGQFASLLKFDLAVATSALDTAYGAGNWSIESILLEITAVTPNNITFNANAAGAIDVDWLTTDSWTETGITWTGLPAVVSGGSQSMGALAYDGGLGTTQYALTSTAGFVNDLTSGGIASLQLSATSDPNASLVINSRNFGTPASRPALIITASPEPGRALLIFLGLTVILARRVRIIA